MIHVLKRMAVRTKLMSSFLLLASFVLILGVTAIIIQQNLEKSQQNTLAGIRLSDAFFEGKYFLRSDMHIFTELVKTETEQRLNYWWGEHEFQIQFFNDQLQKIEKEFLVNKSLKNDTLEKILLLIISDISTNYNQKMMPVFREFHKLKDREIQATVFLQTKPNLTLDEKTTLEMEIERCKNKYVELNQSITQTGLEVITKLDKGKDIVRVLITEIETHGAVLMHRTLRIFLFFTIIGVLFSIFIAYYISHLITRPVQKILSHVKQLGQGEHPEKLEIMLEDEFGKIQKSLNELTISLTQTSEFSKEIGNGNFDFRYEPMGENDILGNSLLQMRDSLKKARTEELTRREEDDRRAWATNGLAKFGDIMRQSGDSLKSLGYNMMSNLIEYTDAVQGALFVINDENPEDIYYELVSAIAYHRDKFLKKEIRLGEGLVGRVAYEEKTIYLKEVPEDYVKITSGLGTANPRTILLVPVKLENKVNGVIELISFKEFEPFKIEFIEKVGENIASFISSIKINEKTARLLTDSRQKSEELAAQEEEMRQNMEELQATQEEAARREEEQTMLWNSLGKMTGIIETDLNGTILTANDSVIRWTGMKLQEFLDKSFTDIFQLTTEISVADLWNRVLSGNIVETTSTVSHSGKETIFHLQINLVNDASGKPVRYLVIAQKGK